MTPKEKAKELIEKMSYNDFDEDHNCSHYVAKNCALILCKEMIYGIEKAFKEYERHKKIKVPNQMFYWDYWSDVQSEIYKL